MIQTNPVILVNRSGALGDVILTTPIIKKIYFDHGGMCSIFVKTYWGEVFKNNPYVNTIIDSNEKIDLSKINKFINLDLSYECNPKMHAIDAYGIFAFGTSLFEKTCQIFTSNEDQLKAISLKEKYPNDFIVLHMRNTHQPNRNIPQGFWLKIIEKILNETSLNIVQIGTSSDYAFEGNDKLIDMRDKFNIHELRETIEQSKCYIGIDSAPIHIAGTTNSDIIGFYTTARSEYRKPFRAKGRFIAIVPKIDCYGCQVNLPLGSTMTNCKRGDNDCVNQFDIEEVMTAFNKIMQTK